MATIILTGGGTAGHCTPHLAILPELKKRFDNIYYIGSYNGVEKDIISRTDIPYYAVPTEKLRRNLSIKNLAMPFVVINGIIKAKKLIKELKPDVIFSKGGFVSIPTVIAGHKLGIPIVAHESDITVGLANRFSSKYCDKVITSFKDTAKSVKNGVFVGSPIRKELFAVDKDIASNYFPFKNKKPVLLVTGGSLGAKKINEVLRASLPIILSKYNVIHICGKGNLSPDNPSGYIQVEFLHNIENAFTLADVCISRAGSNTLFELLALRKNCLIIPLPKNASRGDQILNAEYFKQTGHVNVLFQEELTPESLTKQVDETYKNRFKFKKVFEQDPIQDKSYEIARILFDYV